MISRAERDGFPSRCSRSVGVYDRAVEVGNDTDLPNNPERHWSLLWGSGYKQ